MAEFTIEEIDNLIDETYARNITARQLTAGPAINMYQKTSNSLLRFMFRGLQITGLTDLAPESATFEIARSMGNNVYRLAAAKTFQLIKTMQQFLFKDGVKVELGPFKTKSRQINALFNTTWLEAEQQLAQRQADAAEQWTDILAQEETFPLLKYVTAGDANVRDEHDALDGTVRPVNDRFWSRNFPPNGYNCRCEAVPIERGEEKVTPLTVVKNKNIPEQETLFAMNPGQTGLIFRDSHPYFNVGNDFNDFKDENFGFVIPEIFRD